MDVQLPVDLDKAAFLTWLESHEERYELIDRRAVKLARRTRAHAVIATQLLVIVHHQLDCRHWVALPRFGTDTGPTTLRFPDVVVDRSGGAGSDYAATAPALIMDVLSLETARIDLCDKSAEFLRLPSLAGYFVFAQDERKVWAWIRRSSGLPLTPEVIEGEDAAIDIAALGVRLLTTDVYSNIRFE